jgi:hypothetical protein
MTGIQEKRLKLQHRSAFARWGTVLPWINHQDKISLPYELWYLILGYVSDRLAHPYRLCDWQNFPLYVQQLGSLDAADISDWKNCRLVCRTFSEILTNPIRSTISSSNGSIPEGVKMLYVQQVADPRVAMMITAPHSYCKGLTTLTLNERSDIHSKQSIIILMNGSKALPELRSLTLLGALPSNFWTLLESAFPSLVELYTSGSAKCDISVTFPQLEILHVGAIDSWSLLHCPHLKHLSVGGSLEWGEFLEMHAKHIESLLVRGGTHHLLQPDMLPRFTRLHTYGGPAAEIYSFLSLAPSSSPIPEHLYLCSHSEPAISTAEGVLKVIHRWRNTRFISIDEMALPYWEGVSLARACRERGGRLIWIPTTKDPADKRRLVHLIETHFSNNISQPINIMAKSLLDALYIVLGFFLASLWVCVFSHPLTRFLYRFFKIIFMYVL